MTKYALKKVPGSLWPEITEAEVRENMIGQMMHDLSAHDFPDFVAVVKEMITKHRQLKNDDMTVEEFDKYWEEVKMIRKLLRGY